MGPSWEGEMSTELSDQINWTTEDLLERDPLARIDTHGHDVVYEHMVNQVLREELGPNIGQHRIRLQMNPKHPHDFSPPFEISYTNRVLHVGDFLPIPPEGCGCEGDCADPANFDRCECRARQELVCTTRMGGDERSGRKGFAYDAEGRISLDQISYNEPIIECSASYGCGPECINRVAGHKPSVAVDLVRTDRAGWSVRNPESYPADPGRGIFEPYTDKTIKAGTPLGIYSGDMITVRESIARQE